MTEVRPIDLGLLAWKHLQLQERFALLRTQAGHRAAQLHDTAAVAAVPNHLENARGAQPRMLVESLANEPHVRIDDGRTQRRCAVEALALDRTVALVSGKFVILSTADSKAAAACSRL